MTDTQEAIADLREYLAGYDPQKARQKIDDLTFEIQNRNRTVDTLEKRRSVHLTLADRFSKIKPSLAFAFHIRAGTLLEEIERQRPHALTKKLNDALQEQRDIECIRSVLEEINPET